VTIPNLAAIVQSLELEERRPRRFCVASIDKGHGRFRKLAFLPSTLPRTLDLPRSNAHVLESYQHNAQQRTDVDLKNLLQPLSSPPQTGPSYWHRSLSDAESASRSLFSMLFSLHI
jgi:hypothetical protein